MKSRIRQLAKDRFPSIAAFCRAAKITEPAIRKWERKGLAKAQLGVMVRVAKALDCEVSDLYE